MFEEVVTGQSVQEALCLGWLGEGQGKSQDYKDGRTSDCSIQAPRS